MVIRKIKKKRNCFVLWALLMQAFWSKTKHRFDYILSNNWEINSKFVQYCTNSFIYGIKSILSSRKLYGIWQESHQHHFPRENSIWTSIFKREVTSENSTCRFNNNKTSLAKHISRVYEFLYLNYIKKD